MVMKPLFFILFTIATLLFTKLFIYVPRTLLLSLSLPIFSLVFYLSLSIFNNKTNLPPGPRTVPIFGNWLKVGNDLNHRILAAMSQQYGSIFMLKLGSKNLVVVSDPELATQVLHTKGVEFGSRPRNIVFDIFTGKGQDMAFTVYGDHWRKMRRVMTLPFFTNKVVHHYSDMWEHEMDLVVHDLKKNVEEVSKEGVVVRRRLQLMLYNIMYKMMFDARFDSVDDPLFIEATQFNSERSQLAQSFEYNYGDFFPLLRPFLRGYLNKCKDLQRRRLAFFNRYFVEERRKIMAANGENQRIVCAIDHIIDAQMKGEITKENVLYIVENINVAAVETTLWSIEWAIAELVNHPAVQNKIRDEITAVLKGSPIKETNLHELPYLQATIKETLRLHTPVPLLLPHMNLEEAELCGYTIPKESKIVVNAWWLANNPAWWKNPNEFRPERFLEEEAGIEAVVGRKADFHFIPFGVGRRSCPGIILALPILGLVIGKLVSRFEMQAPFGLGKVDVAEKGGQFSLRIANHSNVVFKPVVA